MMSQPQRGEPYTPSKGGGWREWLVPPVLLPIFFGLLIIAATVMQ